MTPLVAKQRIAKSLNFLAKYEAWEECNDSLLNRAYAGLRSQLDLRNFITPHEALAELGFRYDLPHVDIKAMFGVGAGPAPDRLDEYLSEGAADARKAKWCYRLGTANAELLEAGWYPFFVTLTATEYPWPYRSKEELFQSRALELYRRRLCDEAIKACGVSIREGRKDPSAFFRYSMVIEHGKSRSHHHSHMLCWFRDVPESWKVDPNLGRDDARYHECFLAKRFWPYGWCTFDYFRCQGDPWSELGFVVPAKVKSLRSPYKAGAYLMKYMKKEDKQWSHRMKTTRNLGLESLRKFVQTMDNKSLRIVTQVPRSYVVKRKMSEKCNVPLCLLRSEARREIWERLWISTRSIELRTLRSYNIYKAMRASVAKCLRPWELSLPERHAWLLRCLDPASVARCDREWVDVHDLVCSEFPDLDPQPVKVAEYQQRTGFHECV
jgi:hypothetical protein